MAVLDVLPRPEQDVMGRLMLHFTASHGEVGKLSRHILQTSGKDAFDVPRSGRIRQSVEYVVYNLICAELVSRRFGAECVVAVSRTQSQYKRKPRVYRYPPVPYRPMMQALDRLGSANPPLVLQNKGYRSAGFDKGLRTTIQPTPAFGALLDQYADQVVLRLFQEKGKLLLKDANGELIHYYRSGEIQAMEDRLRQINENNACARYSYRPLMNELITAEFTTPTPILTYSTLRSRISTQVAQALPSVEVFGRRQVFEPESMQFNRCFNGDWNHGGRFYADFQNVFREERATLEIDGQPSVELDFAALHPNMLYHMEGSEAPAEPYLVAGLTMENRRAAKCALLVVFNASDRGAARLAIQKELNAAGVKLVAMSLDGLLDTLLKGHERIAKYFFSGVGLRLQRLDSEIAQNVMMSFVRMQRPCLGVHDSFIVPADLEAALREHMAGCYRTVLRAESRKLGTTYRDWVPPISTK